MRRSPLRRKPPPDRSSEPGYREWHSPIRGRCAVCSHPGPLERHHVIAEQVVRREGGNPWDLRNSLELARYCDCHRNHHHAVRRLPVSAIPEDALAFAVDLLGEDRAAEYIIRYYRVG